MIRPSPLQSLAIWVLCTVFSALSTAAETGLSSHEIYTDFRAFYFEDLDPIDRARPESSELRVRLGLRYNRLIAEDWLLDSDIRGVVLKRDLTDSDNSESATFLEIKRLMLRGENLFGSPFWNLEVGRKRLQTDRSWLLDDDLDTLEFNYDSTLFDVRLGVAKWLWDARIGADDSTLDQDQNIEASGTEYLFAAVEYQWYYHQFISLQWVWEDYERPDAIPNGLFRNPDDLINQTDLRWLNLSVFGEKRYTTNRLSYWLDLAQISGDRELNRLDASGRATGRLKQSFEDGLGYQLGLNWRFDNNRYGLGFSYAHADGDRAFSGDANLYTQPFIATNKERMLGVDRFRYYGEVLAPRLSNMDILSLRAGYALLQNGWLELAWHKYTQDQADNWLYSTRSRVQPNGRSRELGQAVDLLFGGEIKHELDMMIAVGGFFAGDAFDGTAQDSFAYRVSLEFRAYW